ncbi:hypothetical protein [Sphingomonas alpina]|uniref:Uncharacterized protein n=1 Tax=Sphingomonas alpina TaxID=653931 RepID=A0A7H0LM41_9SPHN|nr:hypothetical protein [Sphingomonas alpina]QNQ10744.1 hypothetical protein H3Z74_05995 [Sphingomonas alpina]
MSRALRTADSQLLSELARIHTEAALDAIAMIATDSKGSETVRMAAAVMLLNRGWGRIGAGYDGDDGPEIDLAEELSAARDRAIELNDQRRAAAMEARQGCGCTACLGELVNGVDWE